MKTRTKVVVTLNVPRDGGFRQTDEYQDAVWAHGEGGTLLIRKQAKGVHTIAEYAAGGWISARRYEMEEIEEVG